MNKQTIIDIAAKARESYGDQHGFIVVYFDNAGDVGTVWCESLMSAASFPVGSFAVDKAGNVWKIKIDTMHRTQVASWCLFKEDAA